MKEARQTADRAYSYWRRAVVQHLLLPIEDVASECGGGKRPQIDVAQETEIQRQQRRLADLRFLGGEWVKRGANWRARDRQSGTFKRLVAQERDIGSQNRSEKSVRLDLCAAAEAEAEQRRSGVMLKGLTTP